MDKFNARATVITLCSCIIILTIGGLNIALRTGDIPIQITAIIIAALGYIGGLFTPPPK